MSDEDLAHNIGVSRRTLGTWRKRGCRGTSVAEVLSWRDKHMPPRWGGPPGVGERFPVFPAGEDPAAHPCEPLWSTFEELLVDIDQLQARIDSGDLAQLPETQADLTSTLEAQLLALWLRLPANRHHLAADDLRPALAAFDALPLARPLPRNRRPSRGTHAS